MSDVYKEISLLVSCSTHHEAMGRTPLEAMINGIPSVVSDVGGLPEIVEDAGDIVQNIFSINEWVEKIKKYDNKSYYNKKSLLCKKRFLEFQKKYTLQYHKLKNEIDKINNV
jgi:glycosyltransferase involved in cell wall biosynthesis